MVIEIAKAKRRRKASHMPISGMARDVSMSQFDYLNRAPDTVPSQAISRRNAPHLGRDGAQANCAPRRSAQVSSSTSRSTSHTASPIGSGTASPVFLSETSKDPLSCAATPHGAATPVSGTGTATPVEPQARRGSAGPVAYCDVNVLEMKR